MRRGKFYFTLISILIAFSCLPIFVLWGVQHVIAREQLKSQLYFQSGSALGYFNEQLDIFMEQQTESLKQLSEDIDVIHFMTDDQLYLYKVNYKLQLVFGTEKKNMSAYVLPLGTGNETGTGTKEIPYYYSYPYTDLGWGIIRKVKGTTETVFHLNERKYEADQDVIFSLSKGVYQDGVIIGCIIIDVNRSAIEHMIPETGMDVGADVYVYDDWGFVCFTTSGVTNEGRNKLPEYIPRRSFDQYELQSDDLERLGLLQLKNQSTGLTLVTEVPIFHVDQSLQAIQLSARWTLIICFFLSTLASVVVGNAIVNPLHIIMEEIKRIQKGDFTSHIKHRRNDEFGVLMDSFNEMINRIVYYIAVVEEKQKSLRIAEIKNLQTQIQPHFLYNTLDLIKWNIKLNENEKAVKIITNLGRLLRMLMNTEDVTTVGNEISLVRSYLEIQAIHFNDNLEVVWNIDEQILQAVIPKLILQPIVENCVQHGFNSAKADNRIAITAKKEGEYLMFLIQDNGRGISREQSGVGIGLTNVETRLKLFGDQNCGVLIESSSKGTGVTLVCKGMDVGGINHV